LETGQAIAEVSLCYTGDLLNPAEDLYTLDYYLRLAEQIVEAGAHILAIKDMAGLLRPAAASRLVSALRERFDLPVHLHTHDTAGGQLATLLAASEAGVDAVDVAAAPMSGTTSQPSFSALVAAMANTERDTGISLESVCELEPYWEAVRALYKPFESGLPSPTGHVYHHEIPGGQLSNLRQQAIALGLADDFERIEDMYAAADRILGRVPKVTPSSKVVGDLALHLAAVDADPDEFAEHPERFDVPDSVVGFMAGELGDLPGGWPEPFRSKVLAGRQVDVSVKPLKPEEIAALEADSVSRRATLNALLFPGPTRQFEEFRERYGDLSVLETADYLYGLRPGAEQIVEIERGVQLYVGLEAIGDADGKGMRTVMTTLNGQLRPVFVRDESIKVEEKAAEKADPGNPGHVAAPFAGVVTLKCAVGDEIEAGQPVAIIEAMKMEATITATVGGVVERLAIRETQQVDAGDLLLAISSSE
jgi:pyruvate carboxylase